MKTAVVTGASRGLGAAIAKALKDNEYRVIGTSTSGEMTDNVEQMVKLNLEDQDSIEEAAKNIGTYCKDGIDFLYNNAGYAGSPKNLVEDPKNVRKVIQINLLGLIELTTLLLPKMNAASLIANMSSGAGDVESIYSFNYGAYNISKSAVDYYSRSLAEIIKDRKIKVIATDPEWVATDMGGAQAPKKADAVAAETIKILSDYPAIASGEKYWRGEVKKREEW